ncbi:hypothetical protein FHR55_000703 [Xanthomonas arboricola]
MIISNALRKSAGHHDARCMLNIAGVCDGQGCMLCHIRIAGEVGGAQKPDDVCATFGCGACHRAFDSNGTTHGLKRGSEDWLFYALRGMARTLRWWHQHGFLDIKGAA